MLMSCDAKNGCGSVSMTNPNLMAKGGFRSAQTLPYTQMTGCTAHQQEARQAVSYSANMNGAQPAAGQGMNPIGQNAMFPSADPDIDPDMEMIPGQPDPPAAAIQGGSSIVPEGVLPEDPQIPVPANPLLPPGYQEFISYENLQYLNGFLRTQIGRYMRVEQLIGSSTIEDRYGFLIAVGINYILLQEMGTGNIMTIDYYSIKSLYIYYSQPTLPEDPSLRF